VSAGLVRDLLSRARGYESALEAAGVGRGTGAVSPVSAELRGRVVANLFFEDSTRTRVSFSVAARRLGAETIDLTSVGSSVSKGETVGDTAANVAAMGVDAMVIRHRSSGAGHLVVRTLERGTEEGTGGGGGGCAVCSVINAGDGRHEHPTQGLLDIYTLAERFGRLEGFDLSGLTVAIVGDAGSSRVARSDIAGMTALGARVICVGPPGLVPAGLTSLGCEVSHDLDSVLPRLDAVNVLRIQFERHEVSAGAQKPDNRAAATSSSVIASVREYAELYGLNARRLARMKKHAVVMHPGPINRGVEMTAEVADSQRSMVLRQVTHGVAVRMAVLSACVGAGGGA
jgi:aspartate carbamoyltransferase catalytic subunit